MAHDCPKNADPRNECCACGDGIHQFCDDVEELVEQEYGLPDGGDLCFNLLQAGVIQVRHGVADAARTVAQYIEQA